MASILDRVLSEKSSRAEMAKWDSRDNLLWGRVNSVDDENLLMDVNITGGSSNRILRSISINTNFTSDGYGLRLLPSTNSIVILSRVNDKVYVHIGYHYGAAAQIISNKSNSKDSEAAVILKRSIESGEVQLVGLTNNEIYLSKDGSVLLKSQFGASIFLNNLMHRCEGNFANLRYEMDGVRIRAGNIIRPVVTNTNEDDFIVLDENQAVVKESTLAEDKNGTSLREFEVQVGTLISSDGVDYDPPISPSVGSVTFADKIVTEKAEEIKVLNKSVKFRIKMPNGFSLAIDEAGSMFLLDDTQMGVEQAAGKGNFTNFQVGSTPDKTSRCGESMIIFNNDQGIYIKHVSGSNIWMDAHGQITMNDANKNAIYMQEKGITIHSPDGDINLMGKKIVLAPETNVYIGDPAKAADLILGTKAFSTIFDVHTHTGPVGPVNLLQQIMNPANTANSSAKGIVVT